MSVILQLAIKILPLYFIILLGFIAGRKLSVKKESVAPLLIYIIIPLVIFNSVLKSEVSMNTFSIPLVFYSLCCLMGLLFYHIGRYFWKDSTKNILAFAAGSGNAAYFGTPVAIAIFSEKILGIVVLCVLGVILYENTVGFYLAARGNFSVREALKKIVKLPSIYAFIIALTVNSLHLDFGQAYLSTVQVFQGALSFLGMVVIGLGMSNIQKSSIDYKFISLTFISKFIAWPIIMASLIAIDRAVLGIFSTEVHNVMILLSIIPVAANTVAYATQLNAQPEKAALAVFLSTIFALFYIPIIVSIFLI